MVHLDHAKNERKFTFGDMGRLSSQAANYFRSVGIRQGDRVMLVLKRHWQFWAAMRWRWPQLWEFHLRC